MYKIGIAFYDRAFEHDIYELIRAFFPGEEFVSLFPGDEGSGRGTAPSGDLPEDFDYYFEARSTRDAFTITCRAGERCLSASAPRTDGPERYFSSPEVLHRSLTLEERIARHDVRKVNKDALKASLYGLLSELTGRTLPWGNLTGIRPAKLASLMLEEGKSDSDIIRQFTDGYFASEGKASLALSIAHREKEVLSSFDYKNGYSLYIGIPFCPSICLYCSFSSYPLAAWKKRVDEYLDALIREMYAVSALMKERGRPLHTIYIGGGTPTTLEGEELTRLLSAVEDAFDLGTVREFTVEAGRPDSITPEKLKAIRRFPVTRLSVNPQTMNAETLKIIGRAHTPEDTLRAFYEAREAGFDDINMDLIVGLPGEGLPEVERTLSEIEKLSPENLTVHSLAVKRSARLNIFRDEYREMTFENSQEILDRASQSAAAMGMSPYYLYRQKNMKGNFENVGYARAGRAGIYNILIMEERQSILALGAGGASKLVLREGQQIERVENVKDVAAYISRVDEMIDRKRCALDKYL